MSETAHMLIGRFFPEAILYSTSKPEEWVFVEQTIAKTKRR